jgi:hypothetical protein
MAEYVFGYYVIDDCKFRHDDSRRTSGSFVNNFVDKKLTILIITICEKN